MKSVFKTKILTLCFLLLSTALSAQISGVVNRYQRVTGINYCTNVITLPTTPLFNVGDKVMIIQMKGATVDRTNTSAYGDVTAINSAGKFEFGYVVAKTFNTVTLKAPVINQYDVNASVQLVYVPVYTSNVTVTGTLNCNTWNSGTGVGGVLVIDATGHTVSLGANITADGRGFAGGQASDSGYQIGCAANYYYGAPEDSAGWKGEGIGVVPAATEGAGRGKLANGGGGGNEINAGGAGGSNAGVGGVGGWGFATSSTPPCSTTSIGGMSLTSYFSNNTAYLGGGGGGGHQNDLNKGHGGGGGGIIMIFCNSIEGNGYAITAEGLDAVDIYGSGNSDGGGGGGGGGTIFLYANSFGSTTLNVSAAGGDGGNNDGNGSNNHGPGGGGGGGRIASPSGLPGNVFPNIAGGAAGLTNEGTGIHYGAEPGTQGNNNTGLDLPFEEIPPMPNSLSLCAYTELSFDAAGPAEYTYNWTGPGIAPINSSHLLVNPLTTANDGYFILKLSSPHCSTAIAYDTIDVEIEDCCPYLNSNFGYTIINALTYGPITTDEVWDGKVLITGGVLDVQGSAVLDITNVDVVFDECSGIKFSDDSRLRANNSVFRSCQPDKTWLGIEFLTAGNIVDECVFKNAVIAMDLKDGATAKIHNNLFLNYGKGVSITNCIDYPYAITGNRFVIDKDQPSFEPCGWVGSYSTGIYGYGSTFLENIAQNSFVNHNTYDLNFYRGIEFVESRGTLSSNTFTNPHRAIDVLQNYERVNIENNKIEITESVSGSTMYMINLSNTYAPVFVFNNLISDPNLYAAGAQSTAIYSEFSSSLNINQNEIKGFETGIELYYVFNSIVSENHIKNAIYGIYNEECQIIEISCNEIDLDFENGSTTCVGIYSWAIDTDSRIHSNCILDTKTAIQLTTLHTGRQLPVIRNNFMYNYTEFGVLSSGYQGVLGSMGPGMGLNTFYSNSMPATFDIFNATPGLVINSWNNFNAMNFNAPWVNNNGAVDVHSTASCGLQTQPFGATQVNLDPELHCDDFNFVQGFVEHDGGRFILENNPQPRDMFRTMDACISALHSLESMGDKEKLYSLAIASDLYTTAEKEMLGIVLSVAKTDLGGAMQKLANFVPENEGQELWAVSTYMHIRNRQGIKPSQDELTHWKSFYANDLNRINSLNTWLRSADMINDYHFQTKKIEATKAVRPAIAIDENRLQVYPNPASNVLNVVVSFPQHAERTIRITDIQGRSIRVLNTDVAAGVVQIDISELATGAYIIHINTEEGALTERFVKY